MINLSKNLFFLIFFTVIPFAQINADATLHHPQVTLKTDVGNIVLELYEDKAPKTVASFLGRVNRYYYDGLIFHRVIKGFVIQGGGYTFDLFVKDPGETVVNESSNGLKNRRGTIAMARFSDPDSARAQFFINLKSNRNLNRSHKKPGYTVFGKVIEGMDVVDSISKVPVESVDELTDLPIESIRILSARVTLQ